MDCSPPGSCPWDSPGKHTGAGCPALLQGNLPNPRSKLHLSHLLHWLASSLPLEPPGRGSATWSGHGDEQCTVFAFDVGYGWMASLTQWMWIWVNSGRWWWTGRPGVLLFTGSQRVGHDWATGLKWTELMYFKSGSETFQCKWCRKNTLLEWVRPNPILPLISCRIAGNLLTFHFPNYKMETRPTCIDIRIKFHTHLYVH